MDWCVGLDHTRQRISVSELKQKRKGAIGAHLAALPRQSLGLSYAETQPR